MKHVKYHSLFLVIVTSLLLFGCLSKYNTCSVVGIPVTNKSNTVLVVIVAESEAISHMENGGFVRTTYNSTYWLKQFDISTGRLLKKKKIITDAERNNQTVTVYGGYDNNIWLYATGLQAFDINNLEEVVNENKLAAINSISIDDMPAEERLIKPAITEGYLDYTTFSGLQYRLSLKDMKVGVVPPEQQNKKEEFTRRSLASDNYFGTRCDTFNQYLFAFAKDSSRFINCNPEDNDVSETAYQLTLFRSAYQSKKLGLHNSYSCYNIQQLEKKYLNPVFLVNTVTGNSIRFAQPEGLLVLHQDKIGSNAMALLTRIDINGNKIWETKPGISTKAADCITAGNNCIITANKTYMFSPPVGKDAVVIIDISKGTVMMPALNQ